MKKMFFMIFFVCICFNLFSETVVFENYKNKDYEVVFYKINDTYMLVTKTNTDTFILNSNNYKICVVITDYLKNKINSKNVKISDLYNVYDYDFYLGSTDNEFGGKDYYYELVVQ